jgi:membrane-associated phospholipid phosphatase
MIFLGQIAGIGEILPLFLALALTLALSGRGDVAWRWAAGFVACLAATLILKAGTDLVWPGSLFPSGHVSMAVYTFGGLAFLLLGRGSAAERFGWIAVGTIAVLFGVSLVELTQHDWLDIVGGIVLSVGILLLVGCPRRWPALSPRAKALLALVFVLALIPVAKYGPRLDPILHRYVAY